MKIKKSPKAKNIEKAKKNIKAKKTVKTKTTIKPTASKSVDAIKINSQVWPMERNILFRPDRLKYVRRLIKSDGCVFCEAAKNKPGFETLCVYQTEHSMVVLNKFPYNSGHLLVIPKRHCGDIQQLSEVEYMDLMKLVRKCFAALHESYDPGGINMGLNHGAVAGAGIPEHIHFHVIPRWFGDLNFFPLVADTKVVIESLESTFDRLLGYFKSHE